MALLRKKKNNTKVAGLLGAALVGIGAAAVALLSNKKTRAKVTKTVAAARKKAEVSVRQLEKKLADKKTVSKVKAVKKGKAVVRKRR